MSERMFPIMHGSGLKSIPWRLVAPHENQAQSNHYQSLEVLAGRGGLDPTEMIAILRDREWQNMDIDVAVSALRHFVDSNPPNYVLPATSPKGVQS